MNKDYLFVGVQLLLFGLYAIMPSPFSLILPAWLGYIGLVFTVLGGVFGVVAVAQQRSNLKAVPTPKQNGRLITNGVYGLVRHPIYTGILFCGLGYALWEEGHLVRLLITALLALLFYFKAKYEESLLVEKYPEYIGYKKKTAMLLPFLL